MPPADASASEPASLPEAARRLERRLAGEGFRPAGVAPGQWIDATFLNNLGAALLDARRADLALEAFDLASALGPGLADIRLNRATALIALGRFADAVQACQDALALRPGHPHAPARLGEALLKGGDPAAALPWLERAHAAPDVAINRSAALVQLGRLPEAAEAMQAAVARHPKAFVLHHRLGALRLKLGEVEAAEQACRQATRLKPDYAPAHIGLGAALRRLDRREEAAAACRKAIALDPASATARYNLANVLQELDDDAGAEAAYEAAIEMRPDWPSARFNHGVWLLKQGRWTQGWEGWEWRWRTDGFKGTARTFAAPQWNGEALQGKTILLHPEQGLGDLIQCARFVPLLARRGARVLLEAPEPLRTLFAGLEGAAEVLAPRGTAPAIDYHCPYFSLPRGFGARIDELPNAPYLRADPERAAAWRERLGAGLKIGVAWQGNPAARVERGRSFPLAALAPLAAPPGARLISLQKRHGLEQLADPPFAVETLGQAYDAGDFAETAAVIANLDLVVACDTAVAHLAGALGRPVWLAIKVNNDWRWLKGRSDTPWYPTARLYRQAERGDWSGVFAAMARDLGRLPPLDERP